MKEQILHYIICAPKPVSLAQIMHRFGLTGLVAGQIVYELQRDGAIYRDADLRIHPAQAIPNLAAAIELRKLIEAYRQMSLLEITETARCDIQKVTMMITNARMFGLIRPWRPTRWIPSRLTPNVSRNKSEP